MAENKNNPPGELEKLALIVDSLQTLFKGKSSVIFELNKDCLLYTSDAADD